MVNRNKTPAEIAVHAGAGGRCCTFLIWCVARLWQLVANEDKVLLKGALAESCDPFLKFGTPCLSLGTVR